MLSVGHFYRGRENNWPSPSIASKYRWVLHTALPNAYRCSRRIRCIRLDDHPMAHEH